MARGAAAAKATMVVSADSSYPIEQIAEATKTPLWYQVYLDSEVPAKVPQAMKAGCKALCITATSALRLEISRPAAAGRHRARDSQGRDESRGGAEGRRGGATGHRGLQLFAEADHRDCIAHRDAARLSRMPWGERSRF